MTTPYKTRRRFHRQQLDDEADSINPTIQMPLFPEDDRMVTSPPREKKQLPTARLFDDDDNNNERLAPPPLFGRGMASSPPQGRKRLTGGGGRPAPHVYEDSDEEMFASPRGSPTFRTMDGRMVTSKNPFSPYATPSTMEDVSVVESPMKTNPPVFPFCLASSSSSTNTATSATRGSTAHSTAGTTTTNSNHGQIKINLQRRDTQTATPFKSNYFSLSKTGYPNRSGRYSFTGSPIEEVDVGERSDTATSVGRKVRKLHVQDTVRSGEMRRQGHSNSNRLFVDTDEANSYNVAHNNNKDDVSPTDVMHFPTPPTPSKVSRTVSGYTPLLRTGPPQTPTMDRRSMARRTFDDDDDDDLEDEEDDMMTMTVGGGHKRRRRSRFREDFDVIGQLGDGSFGTVYKCLSRLDGCMYAIKAAKRKAKGVADRDRMLKEVYALAALSDQADTAAFHIVRYHQAWMDENRLYIQTELCSSTLQAELENKREGGSIIINTKRRYKLLREILLALEFIHRNGMVHLDIKVRPECLSLFVVCSLSLTHYTVVSGKPENIFIKNDQFKLGDFGLVSKVTNDSDVEEGDSRYMSKELLSGDHNDLTKVREREKPLCPMEPLLLLLLIFFCRATFLVLAPPCTRFVAASPSRPTEKSGRT